MAARRMEDSDSSEDYGLPSGTPWICSPLMEMTNGPAFHTQPALDGDLPADNTGLLPQYEFQRKGSKE